MYSAVSKTPGFTLANPDGDLVLTVIWLMKLFSPLRQKMSFIRHLSSATPSSLICTKMAPSSRSSRRAISSRFFMNTSHVESLKLEL